MARGRQLASLWRAAAAVEDGASAPVASEIMQRIPRIVLAWQRRVAAAIGAFVTERPTIPEEIITVTNKK